MALAWKCDRCGKYFEGTVFDVRITPSVLDQENNYPTFSIIPDPESNDMVSFYACSECARKILQAK